MKRSSPTTTLYIHIHHYTHPFLGKYGGQEYTWSKPVDLIENDRKRRGWEIMRKNSKIIHSYNIWDEMRDLITGAVFYFNRESKDSQWSVPFEIQVLKDDEDNIESGDEMDEEDKNGDEMGEEDKICDLEENEMKMESMTNTEKNRDHSNHTNNKTVQNMEPSNEHNRGSTEEEKEHDNTMDQAFDTPSCPSRTLMRSSNRSSFILKIAYRSWKRQKHATHNWCLLRYQSEVKKMSFSSLSHFLSLSLCLCLSFFLSLSKSPSVSLLS